MTSRLDRRAFLFRSAAAGAAVGLAGAPYLQFARAAASPNGEIRAACIGLRGKGGHHQSGLEAVEGAAVTALCDVDESVLNSCAEQFEKRTGRKIKRFTDYRKLVEDPEIDVVSIATPNHTHALIGIAAIVAGKDVYVEKPCSHNIWEGRQLVKAARKHQRMCQHGSEGYMQVYYFGYRTYLGQKREPGPGWEEGSNEYERFIAAVRSRKIADLGVDIEDGHLSSALCHLGNIAYRLGRTVAFDPVKESFPGDPEASKMLSRDYRKPFVVPEIV
jgi:predicted dehydrogenase